MIKQIEVHKDTIRAGDAILHNGKEMTVGKKNIKQDGFMGVSIFGDSYRLGYKKVIKILL